MAERKILTIDGGGLRGLIPAYFLQELEHQCGRRVWEMFDIIAGTSTGGILALCLTAPNADGTNKFSAAECYQLYEEHAGRIFPRWRRFTRNSLIMLALNPWTYPSKGLEDTLQEYLVDMKLSECLKRVLIYSVNLRFKRPLMFDSLAAGANARNDYLARMVARATSAAPTFFPPAIIKSLDSTNELNLIDGGMVLNNPAAAAYIQCKKSFPTDEVLLLSLGTGAATFSKNAYAADVMYKPPVAYSPDLVSICMDGSSKNVHSSMLDQLPIEACPHDILCEKRRYYRIQVKLEPDLEDMDDASPRTIRRLRELAEEMVADNIDTVQSLVKKLS